MRTLYANWQESGLGKKAFAEQGKISPSTFYYWAKKFEKAKSKASTKKGFEPILLESVVSHPTAIAIVRYPSGVSLEWHGAPETIALLKTLL